MQVSKNCDWRRSWRLCGRFLRRNDQPVEGGWQNKQASRQLYPWLHNQLESAIFPSAPAKRCVDPTKTPGVNRQHVSPQVAQPY